METMGWNDAYAFIHSRCLKIDAILISVNSILKMVLTEEEESGKSRMFAYIDDYNNESDDHAKNIILANLYAALIQCPSLISKFPRLRNVVRNKILEFEQMEFYGVIILKDFKFTLQTLKYILITIHTRVDYVDYVV